jgi:hypothetical protein
MTGLRWLTEGRSPIFMVATSAALLLFAGGLILWGMVAVSNALGYPLNFVQ